ncbi:heparinase II/III family protein [Bacillus sp. EAC]|uniref:heparinase II/III family protein n=1 Tax=Bacillus sp. EAC TaxID=1978338 RepID=UPI000B43CE19|nr:heparinase II/III family protein [Bacillus sp. EAC]
MRNFMIALLSLSIFISTSIHSFAEKNKEIYLTKRSSISEKTLDYANQILNGELFVSPNYPAYKVNKSINWKEDPYHKTTWRLYYQSMDTLSYLTNAYEMTNDTKYLNYGLSLIQSFWQFNHNPDKATDSYTYEAHAIGNRTNNLMYFYHFYANSPIATESNKNYLKTILRKHGRILNDSKYYNFRSNHGIYQDRALLELSAYFPAEDESVVWRKNAINRTNEHIKRDFTEDGLHKEHSPMYFSIVLDLINDMNQIAKDNELSKLILRAQNAFSKLVLSDFTLPGIGDSDYTDAPTTTTFSELDPEYEYILTRGKNGKQPALVNNISNSVVVIRDGFGLNTSSIVFNASNFSAVHKHADDLSFLLTQNGQPIFIDSGKYSYDTKDPIQRYLRSTFAHNVVTVDGKSYPISIDNAGKTKISNFIDNSTSVIITGEHTIYNGVSVFRTLIYLKEKKVILIQDEILSDISHKTNQVFNIAQDLLTQAINPTTILLNKTITLKQHKSSIFTEYFGQSSPLRGFASTSFNQYYPIKQLDFESNGKNIQYFTSISTTPITVSNFSLKEDQYTVTLSDGSIYKITKPITTPFVNEVSDHSTKISGFTQGKAQIIINNGQKLIARGQANASGNFSIRIPLQVSGRTLTITVINKNLLNRAKNEIIVKDKTVPTLETITYNPKTKTISGKTDKNSNITFKINQKTYSTKSDIFGNFTIRFPELKSGSSITVNATDLSGNTSMTKIVKVQ